MEKDDFVRDILEDDPHPRMPTESSSSLSRELLRGESMKTIPESPTAKTRLLSESSLIRDSDNVSWAKGKSAAETIRRAQSLFRYSLIFINFTFIVAAMLLIMAGAVARENNAVKLCDGCGDLTLVAITFGIALWLFAIFGFNWIRQRNILLLLVYVAFLAVLSVTLLGVIIAAGVFDAQASQSGTGGGSFLLTWEASVNDTSGTGGLSLLCDLQRQFNCSGYQFGCCMPGVCFDADRPPPWVPLVCPNCTAADGGQPTAKVCTDIVYETLRRNMGGFLVISGFSMLLVGSGILLAFLARKINQSVGAGKMDASPPP